MGLDMPPHFQDVPRYQICYVTGKVRIGKDTCSFNNRPVHHPVFEKNAGPNHIISGPQYALLHTVNTCVMLLGIDFLELFSIML